MAEIWSLLAQSTSASTYASEYRKLQAEHNALVLEQAESVADMYRQLSDMRQKYDGIDYPSALWIMLAMTRYVRTWTPIDRYIVALRCEEPPYVSIDDVFAKANERELNYRKVKAWAAPDAVYVAEAEAELNRIAPDLVTEEDDSPREPDQKTRWFVRWWRTVLAFFRWSDP